MKVNMNAKPVTFDGEDGQRLVIRRDNRGEPFRDGVALSLESPDFRNDAYVWLEEYEGRKLRDFLNELFPK